MRFVVKEPVEQDVQLITGWRDAAPLLDMDMYRALYGADKLYGAFGWTAKTPNVLDFYLCLHPNLLGRGHGLAACACALAWLQASFSPQGFRLMVCTEDLRARRVLSRLGFVPLAIADGSLLMGLDVRPWRDATRPLENGMPVYHGDPPFDRHLFYHKEDCGWDMSVFAMSAHTGTHIDAPAHIGLPDDTESFGIDRFCGIAQLLDWPTSGIEMVRSPRMLLKLHGGSLTLSDAQALIDSGVTMLGVDAVSVSSGEAEWAVHDLLLRSDVAILENAALEAFAPGWYDMRCLPLPLPGSDGAPVRLFLREESL